MTYIQDSRGRTQQQQPQRVDVLLPRRSLQIQTGKVRYNFRHGIDKGLGLGLQQQPSDDAVHAATGVETSTAGLPQEGSPPQLRRVSITFRQNAFQGYNI